MHWRHLIELNIFFLSVIFFFFIFLRFVKKCFSFVSQAPYWMVCVITFQGMAFTIEERQMLGIHGLLPAAVKTQEEQLELCRLNLERYTDDLSKYIYLIGLLVHEHGSYRRRLIGDVLSISPCPLDQARFYHTRWFSHRVLFLRIETRNSSTVCWQKM